MWRAHKANARLRRSFGGISCQFYAKQRRKQPSGFFLCELLTNFLKLLESFLRFLKVLWTAGSFLRVLKVLWTAGRFPQLSRSSLNFSKRPWLSQELFSSDIFEDALHFSANLWTSQFNELLRNSLDFSKVHWNSRNCNALFRCVMSSSDVSLSFQRSSSFSDVTWSFGIFFKLFETFPIFSHIPWNSQKLSELLECIF